MRGMSASARASEWVIALGVFMVVFSAGPAVASVVWSGPTNLLLQPPQTPEMPEEFTLDLDANGEADFVYTYFARLEVLPARSNGVLTGTETVYSHPVSVNSEIGSATPADRTWHAGDAELLAWVNQLGGAPVCVGPWSGITNGFMPIRVVRHGSVHYGWVQMSCATNYPIAMIHGWAYETRPGVSLFAGATGQHYVASSGSHTWPFSSWPTAATNIQAAVDAADDGHVVIVSNGTYIVREEIAVTRAITVRGFAGASGTIVSGDPPLFTNRCFHLTHPDAVIADLTLANGNAGSNEVGGGVFCDYGGTVRDCVLIGNTASVGGGAACLETGTVERCTFSNNTADVGGGLAMIVSKDGGIVGPLGAVVQSSDTSGDGALFARDCVFVQNAAWAGGGLAIEAGLVSNCVVAGNVATNIGGGAACVSDGVLVQCVIQGNRAAFGGGVGLAGDAAAIGCRIANNLAEGVGGGAVLFSGGELRNCVLTQNVADRVGGVSMVDGGQIVHSTVVSNRASGTGGISLGQGSTVRNSIVYFNEAVSNGANWFVEASGETVDHTCTEPLAPGPGNTASAPLFVDLSTGNLHLAPGSPCIDMAASIASVVCDFDRVPRPLDGNADKTAAWDMGAFEYIHPFADTDGDGLVDTNELYGVGTSPIRADTDGDGMPDGWEVAHGLAPLSDDAAQDSDRDGVNNLGEYIADTDPQNPDSVLSLIRVGTAFGGVRIHWKGGRDAWQFLECRPGLAAAAEPWTAVFAVPPPTPTTNAIIDLGATNTTLFYRIRAER